MKIRQQTAFGWKGVHNELLSNGSRKNYSENSRNPAARAVCHEPEIITKQPLSLVEYKKAPNSNLLSKILMILGR